MRRLPPRSAVSQVNTNRGAAIKGEIGRCAVNVHITPQTPKLPKPLRFGWWANRFGYAQCPAVGVSGRYFLHPSWLQSHHLRCDGASSCQRQGVCAYGAYGRALMSVSMNAQHSKSFWSYSVELPLMGIG